MELATIDAVFKGQEAFEYDVLNNYFWDMFIADAFIANGFRHNRNWGFLYNKKNDALTLAPLFSCARSLYSSLASEAMQNFLISEKKVHTESFSALKQNKKIYTIMILYLLLKTILAIMRL